MRNLFIGFTLMASVNLCHAECPTADTMARVAADWSALAPATGLDKDMSLADARCGQRLLLQALARTQGRPVGYKAGLTNAAVQKRFGAEGPVRGTLFEKMLVGNAATLPAKFGTRPLMEGDLILEVGDEGINAATTPAEVLRHISRIIPFIELPDLTLDPKEVLNAATLTAINVGARLGVVGEPIPAAPEHLEALASMSVVIVDTADGNKELGRGPGTAILDHPLNAVIWLARDLAAEGKKLTVGDKLSLGSFTPLISPKPGMTAEMRYEGFPGNPAVSVSFR